MKSVILLFILCFIEKNTIKKQNKNNETFKYLLDIVHDFVKRLKISEIQAVPPCFGSRGAQVRILVPRHKTKSCFQLIKEITSRYIIVLARFFYAKTSYFSLISVDKAGYFFYINFDH